MDNKVILKLSGDNVSMESLGEALKDTESLLAEIDCSISGEKTFRWDINALNKGSVIVEAIPADLPVESPGNSGKILQCFWDGLHSLESTNERPEGFSDRALDLARRLVKISEGMGSMTFNVQLVVLVNIQVLVLILWLAVPGDVNWITFNQEFLAESKEWVTNTKETALKFLK